MSFVLSRDAFSKLLDAKGFEVSDYSYFEEDDYLDACHFHWVVSDGEYFANLILEGNSPYLLVCFYPDDYRGPHISWRYNLSYVDLVKFGFIKS